MCGAAVIWGDLLMRVTMVVVKWDVKLMSEGIDDGGADTKAGKGAWTGHESYLGNVVPIFAVCG